MNARCPDCSAVAVDRELKHDPTCPLMLAIEAVVDADRDWFAAHPWATVRHRPLHAVERTEYGMFGYSHAARMTHTQVIQVGPGLRARHPYGGGVLPYTAEQVEHVLGRLRVARGAS